jgi:putative ABC transport system substrate-binding protein
MRRRQFIAGLGSAAAWPVVARAQQPVVPVIGFLSAQSAEVDYKNVTVAFLQGLKETGYVEGQNVAVEYRYAENQFDRLPALAADLVRHRVAVIVAGGNLPALAAKAATTTIPIVFVTAVDPVALGLVASLNRPGGNLTGSIDLQAELAPKRLQLLSELMPNTAVFGVLADPATVSTRSLIPDLKAAAHTLGRQLVVVYARTGSDLEAAFASLLQQRVGAVLVGSSNFYNRRTEQLAALAASHSLPAIYPYREFVPAGGLMSYGSSLGYVNHRAGIYAGRILKGEKPADLPVEQATRLELVINLKTAKALGLNIPETLLATADEVIQTKRRAFITGLGSAAAWPLAVWAQQGDRLRRIGILMVGDENDPVRKTYVPALTHALAGLGWTDGRNVRIDLRWAGSDPNRVRGLAQELVGLQPDIIVTNGTGATVAVQRETRTIPIVFALVADPVASGIVTRFDRPSGNITGFASYETTMGGKWLELLSEIAPGLKRAAIMFNPDTAPASTHMPSLETAARSLKVVPIIAPIHSDAEIETAIRALGREPGGGLVVISDFFTTEHRASIIMAAARNNVPAVYAQPAIARDGGLLSYGADTVDIFRRAAAYVDRILRGEKPGDLPVQLPTKFEFVINLKTAKALGLTVPQSILLRADEVIE